MYKRSIALTDAKHAPLSKLLAANEEHHVMKTFLIHDEFLPQYIIDNTVYAETNPENYNSFESYAQSIRHYIVSHNVRTIYLFLANESLKQVSEVFADIPDLKCFILPYGKDHYGLSSTCNSFLSIDISKPRLRFLQINLSNHCNLNCKGCANYSNLVPSPDFYDINQLYSDYKQLKNYFWGIETLKLMGGEPLLNPQICDHIQMARAMFPDANIQVGTNGLLINQTQLSLFRHLKDNDVSLLISIYPATRNRQEEIERILSENNVKYKILRFQGKFMKYLSETPVLSSEDGYKHCPARECHCMENGILSVCGRPLYVHRLNNTFKTSIPDSGGKWNLYDMNVSPWKLDQLLRTPFETCRYCGPRQYFDWDVCKKRDAKKEDWFIDAT